jgi:hypothetical protein
LACFGHSDVLPAGIRARREESDRHLHICSLLLFSWYKVDLSLKGGLDALETDTGFMPRTMGTIDRLKQQQRMAFVQRRKKLTQTVGNIKLRGQRKHYLTWSRRNDISLVASPVVAHLKADEAD